MTNAFSRECPICGSSKKEPQLAELSLCLTCGAVYNLAWEVIVYEDDYFTNGYKVQYGRTYEEDFPQIYAAAQNRLARINHIQKKYNRSNTKKKSLLDIGCALGFFLKAASDAGFANVEGIEVSSYAADYCKKNYNFHVRCEPFEQVAEIGTFDVISAWYFLEHCENPIDVTAKIYASLPHGGIFAFSVPSIFGPMYSFKRQEWAATRPKDHLIDLSPHSVKVLLRKVGFRKVKVYAAGFHPERVVPEDSFFYNVFAKLYRLFTAKSGYSDTIEVYAVK